MSRARSRLGHHEGGSSFIADRRGSLRRMLNIQVSPCRQSQFHSIRKYPYRGTVLLSTNLETYMQGRRLRFTRLPLTERLNASPQHLKKLRSPIQKYITLYGWPQALRPLDGRRCIFSLYNSTNKTCAGNGLTNYRRSKR